MKRMLLSVLIALPFVAHAQDKGIFTAEQAARGEGEYARHCASCHGDNLQGDGRAPALTGDRFLGTWGDRSVGELHAYIASAMPLGAGGSLTTEQYTNIVAFLLTQNGAEAGTEPYTGDNAQASVLVNDALALESTGDQPVDVATAQPIDNDEVGTTFLIKPIAEWEPVTAERIREPLDGDWLNIRRTLDGHSASPLTQISTANVGELRHEWAWPSNDDFTFEITPAVANGIMFVSDDVGGVGRVIALDATNGDEHWIYERIYPDGISGAIARGVVLYEDMVLWAAADGVMVALDVTTGEEIWETTTLDYRDPLTGSWGSQPIVARGKVIAGNNGGDTGARGRLDALDVHSGEHLWTAFMTPDEGAPGSETWGDAFPNGAAPWLTPSFDEELGLVYAGTGQPDPWTPLLRGSRDYDPYEDAALYSNNIVAVDVETGELVWNFPVLPGDFWDLDAPFEVLLFDAVVDGEERQLLYQASKSGWAIVLDRATGEFINSYTFAETNIIDHFTEDGRIVYAEDQIPTLDDVANGTQFFTCPTVSGARSIGTHSYSERTGLVYLAAVDACMDTTFTLAGNYGINYTLRKSPHQDHIGTIRAIDPLTGALAWEYVPESGTAIVGGTLSTAGGLVFAGTTDRWFFALDERTGEELWRTRLNGDVGQPVSYSVDGRQFIAVVGGANFYQTQFMHAMLGMQVPAATGVVWAFALPEQE